MSVYGSWSYIRRLFHHASSSCFAVFASPESAQQLQTSRKIIVEFADSTIQNNKSSAYRAPQTGVIQIDFSEGCENIVQSHPCVIELWWDRHLRHGLNLCMYYVTLNLTQMSCLLGKQIHLIHSMPNFVLTSYTSRFSWANFRDALTLIFGDPLQKVTKRGYCVKKHELHVSVLVCVASKNFPRNCYLAHSLLSLRILVCLFNRGRVTYFRAT